MALVDLKSKLSNFRSNFVTPGVEKKNAPEASALNIDKIPNMYSGKTQFTVPFIETSLFDRASKFIVKYSGNTKFTPKYVDVNSKFNKDSANIKFSPSGVYLPDNFTPAKINSSKFNIDSNPTKFSPSGIYLPELFTTAKINASKFNIDSTPSKFSPSGIYRPTGFSIKKINSSKFNIDSTPAKFSPNTKYIPTKYYPENVIPMTTSRWGRWAGPRPPAVNFFNDKDSNAKGFTINIGKPGRLPNPISGDQSQFLSFKYTKTISTPYGGASLTKQLGSGISLRNLESGTQYDWFNPGSIFDKGTKQAHTGFHSGNLYAPKGIKFKGYLAPTYNTNSPIDELYKKYNLQDEANSDTSTSPYSSYIRQPFIERGIQRKGKESPQRWGIGNFDDGLIRSGITTAIERAAVDTARIAKWMATPKGLLWIAKQIGLGLSNPKVEAIGGPLTRATRIHAGVTSLLSVAGNAFGLHFTRHGIPFRNETASYENVIKLKNTKAVFDTLPELSNRLLTLYTEFGLSPSRFSNLTLTTKGSPILTLSGFAGPNSVYGIGVTDIRRSAESIKNGADDIRERRTINPFSRVLNYNGPAAGYKTSIKTASRGYERPAGAFGRPTPQLLEIAQNLFKQRDVVKGQSPSAKDYSVNPYSINLSDRVGSNLADRKTFSDKLYVGSLRANTGHDEDPNKDTTKRTAAQLDTDGSENLLSLRERLDASKNKIYNPESIQENIDPEGWDLIQRKTYTPTFKRAQTFHQYDRYENSVNSLEDYDNNSELKQKADALPDDLESMDAGANGNTIATSTQRQNSYPSAPVNPIDTYVTLAYTKIPNRKTNTISSFNDFRDTIGDDAGTGTNAIQEEGLLGGRRGTGYYESNNLETKYGLGALGKVGADRSNPNEFIIPAEKQVGDLSVGRKEDRLTLSVSGKFRGDKVTAINVVKGQVRRDEVYGNTSDLIKFYFEDGNQGINVMPFRCTMTGFSDNFSPGWNKIDIMGRPDGAYLYESFERTIGFSFLVAALTRSEMIPMWRKLNKLATYTMPDFDGDGGRPAGPFMRISIGNLFQQTPGFITSLNYTIPDDATWDIADDFDKVTNPTPKQLPMMVEAQINFTVVGDFRPQLNGRVYSLQPLGGRPNDKGDWLRDAAITPPKPKKEEVKKTDPTPTPKPDENGGGGGGAVTPKPLEIQPFDNTPPRDNTRVQLPRTDAPTPTPKSPKFGGGTGGGGGASGQWQ